MADTPPLTVQSTRNWSWTRAYNLQLPAETRAEYFPDVDHGESLLVRAEHDGVACSIFAKVDLEDIEHLEPGEVGIGLNLRYALGVATGETVRVSDESPPDHRTGRIDDVLGRRPVLCRVRKGVHPDVGFDVCRISESTMDALGIAPGDHVVVESTRASMSLKALPAREEISDRKRKQTAQNPDRYPDPVDALELEGLAGTRIDIPDIYLDSERREELGLGVQTNASAPSPLASGVCQPVKVSRNATSVYARSLNEVTVPVIVGLFATIFVFEPWLGPVGNVAIIGLGLLFVLLSISYHVRKTTLG